MTTYVVSMLWLFVNNVAVNMGVQVHFEVMISFPSNIFQDWDIYTDVEPYVRSILIFSIMDVPIYIPPQGSLLSTSLPRHYFFIIFCFFVCLLLITAIFIGMR